MVEKLLTNWMSICLYAFLRVSEHINLSPSLDRDTPHPFVLAVNVLLIFASSSTCHICVWLRLKVSR